MPASLHPDDYELWLGGNERKLDLVKELLRPYPGEEMADYPVSTSINRPHSQGAELIAPLSASNRLPL